MTNPCDYPLELHGIASSPSSIPDRRVLYTGYSFLVDTAFTCPITSIDLRAGDLIFWDEAYKSGTWRILRDNLVTSYYTWDAIWTCPDGPWTITLQSTSPTGVATPWYRMGDNFQCVTTSASTPEAPDQWLRPVYAYFYDSLCTDNSGSITCSVALVSGGPSTTFTVDAVVNCYAGGPGAFVGNFLPGVYRFTYVSGASMWNNYGTWNDGIQHHLYDGPTVAESTMTYGMSVSCTPGGYPTYETAEAAWAGTYIDLEICRTLNPPT